MVFTPKMFSATATGASLSLSDTVLFMHVQGHLHPQSSNGFPNREGIPALPTRSSPWCLHLPSWAEHLCLSAVLHSPQQWPHSPQGLPHSGHLLQSVPRFPLLLPTIYSDLGSLLDCWVKTLGQVMFIPWFKKKEFLDRFQAKRLHTKNNQTVS